jgi:hypothetical protein
MISPVCTTAPDDIKGPDDLLTVVPIPARTSLAGAEPR